MGNEAAASPELGPPLVAKPFDGTANRITFVPLA
jgi:hypothetical protein